MVIYVDVLLVTNFLISYFLLIGSSLLTGYTYSRKRILISSIVGAFFCLYIFVEFDNNVLDFLIKITSLLICILIAYGIKNKRAFVMQSICYVFLNMLITGITMGLSFKSSVVLQKNMFFYFDINPILLVLSSCLIYFFILVFQLIRERVTPQEIYSIDIIFKDFTLKSLQSFYDTGFKVKDIIANRDVILVSFDKVKENIPINISTTIQNYFEGIYNDTNISIIPIFLNTIQGGGMIPALKSEFIIIDDKKVENIMVAFTKNELCENVTAIFGTDIKRQL